MKSLGDLYHPGGAGEERIALALDHGVHVALAPAAFARMESLAVGSGSHRQHLGKASQDRAENTWWREHPSSTPPFLQNKKTTNRKIGLTKVGLKKGRMAVSERRKRRGRFG